MGKLDKIHVLMILFIILVLVLVVNPSIIKNMYSSFLGRIMLVFIVLFFAMNNMTLGLLTALVFIIMSNMILINQEGLETMDDVSDTTITGTGTGTNDTTPSKEEKDKSVNNIDMEIIKESLKSLSSNTIPPQLPTKMSTEDVVPAPPQTEAFQGMYAPF